MTREMVFRTDTRLVGAIRRVFALLAERLELPHASRRPFALNQAASL